MRETCFCGRSDDIKEKERSEPKTMYPRYSFL